MNKPTEPVDLWQLSIDAAKRAWHASAIKDTKPVKEPVPDDAEIGAREEELGNPGFKIVLRQAPRVEINPDLRRGPGSGSMPVTKEHLIKKHLIVGKEHSVQNALAYRIGGEMEVNTDFGRADIVQWESKLLVEVKTFGAWKAGIGQVMTYSQEPSIYKFDKCVCLFNVEGKESRLKVIDDAMWRLGISLIYAVKKEEDHEYDFLGRPFALAAVFDKKPAWHFE